MAACTRCGFEQNGTTIYCERCGLFLPTLAIYNPGQPENKVPPQIVASHPNQKFLFESGLTTQMVLNRSIREGIAVVGLFIAGFGMFGLFNHLLGAAWALLLGLLIVVGGIIAISILFFVQKHLPHLRWSQIVVGVIGATIICFIVIVALSGIVQNSTLGKDFGYGATIFLYGLSIVALVMC